MSRVAIRAENLSKQFQIGPAQPPYHALREYISNVLTFAAGAGASRSPRFGA